jgi:hypothetical protein
MHKKSLVHIMVKCLVTSPWTKTDQTLQLTPEQGCLDRTLASLDRKTSTILNTIQVGGLQPLPDRQASIYLYCIVVPFSVDFEVNDSSGTLLRSEKK